MGYFSNMSTERLADTADSKYAAACAFEKRPGRAGNPYAARSVCRTIVAEVNERINDINAFYGPKINLADYASDEPPSRLPVLEMALADAQGAVDIYNRLLPKV